MNENGNNCDPLTSSEKVVLYLSCSQKSNKDIAEDGRPGFLVDNQVGLIRAVIFPDRHKIITNSSVASIMFVCFLKPLFLISCPVNIECTESSSFLPTALQLAFVTPNVMWKHKELKLVTPQGRLPLFLCIFSS